MCGANETSVPGEHMRGPPMPGNAMPHDAWRVQVACASQQVITAVARGTVPGPLQQVPVTLWMSQRANGRRPRLRVRDAWCATALCAAACAELARATYDFLRRALLFADSTARARMACDGCVGGL